MIDLKTLESYLLMTERARDMAGQVGGADASYNSTYALCLVLEGLIRHEMEAHASITKARQAKATKAAQKVKPKAPANG